MFQRLFRFTKIMWRMSGTLPWVGDPNWDSTDSTALRNFLVSKHGKRFRMVLLNMVLRQNAQAVSGKKELEFDAGFANGVRVTVHTVETLAIKLEESEEFASDTYGVEYLASQDPTATDVRFGTMNGRG